MKNLAFTFILILSLCSSLFAQRVDIDRMYLRVNSRRLPNKVLGEEYKTYSVNIQSTISTERYTNQSYRDKINIIGLKPAGGMAHINFKVKLDDLILESTSVKERVEVKKDKDGKETGRSYYYWAEVIYSFSASASVTDYKNNSEIGFYVLSRREDKKTMKSSEYDSYKGAADYYNNNRLEIKTRLLDEQINNALGSLNNTANSEFGYPTDPDSPHIWYVDSKKHPEYQNSQDVCNKVKAILNGLVPDDSIKDAKANLKDAITYFEKLPTMYANPEEKADKKIRYMAYFNLSTIYYYLDEPEQASIYGQKLIDNDYDTSDGKRMIRISEELTNNFKKHNVKTRHFPIDLSMAEPPKMQ